MSVQMKVPQPQSQIITVGLTTYKPDVYGFIQANVGDVLALLNAGCTVTPIRDNLTATVDPTATDDSSKDFAARSTWFNATSGAVFDCFDATLNAAVWLPRNVSHEIGKLIGANMNVTTDQPFQMFVPGNAKFRVTKITAKNASTSLTTAVGGVYSAASKGGDAIVAATQIYSALTAAGLAVDLTIASTPGKTLYAQTTILTLALTTAQGGAATADLFAYGDIYN